MITDQAEFATLCTVLAEQPSYALDFEFHRERTYFPEVALLQVAWAGGAALVDPLAVDLAGLAQAFEGDGVAVLHAAAQDLEILDLVCHRRPGRLFDTQVAAGFLGYSSPGLGALLARELGMKLPKGDRLTNWARRPLSAEQIEYAEADVAHLLPLRDALLMKLDAAGRRTWAEEECAELLAKPRPRSDPATAWWRLKEARRLRGSARAVAQAVAEWREREAMRRNVLTRFVLSDMAITALAYRPPKTLDDLRHVRGLDPKYLRGRAVEDLLAAVRAGLDLSPEDLRLPPGEDPDAALRPTVTLIAAWISERARDLRLDATLIATRTDVEALLRGDSTGRLAHGWRFDLVGEAARRLARGDASLAMTDGRLVLEERSHRTITAPSAGTTPV